MSSPGATRDDLLSIGESPRAAVSRPRRSASTKRRGWSARSAPTAAVARSDAMCCGGWRSSHPRNGSGSAEGDRRRARHAATRPGADQGAVGEALPRLARPARRTDRGARTPARRPVDLHRMRLPVAADLPAVQPGRRGRRERTGTALPPRRRSRRGRGSPGVDRGDRRAALGDFSICPHGNSTRTASSPSRCITSSPNWVSLISAVCGNVCTRPPRNVISVSIEPPTGDDPPARTSMNPDRSVRLGRRSRPRSAPSATVHRMDDRYERGRERFLEVHDEKALRAVEGLGELGHQIVAYVYGDLYTQPALSDRDRELGAVVALTALGRSSQLPQHLRAALTAGLTEAELREAIMLTASIAGFPPAMNATATLEERARRAARDAEEPLMTALPDERGGVVPSSSASCSCSGSARPPRSTSTARTSSPCRPRACTSRRATANASPRRSASPPDEASTSRRSCATTGPSRSRSRASRPQRPRPPTCTSRSRSSSATARHRSRRTARSFPRRWTPARASA